MTVGEAPTRVPAGHGQPHRRMEDSGVALRHRMCPSRHPCADSCRLVRTATGLFPGGRWQALSLEGTGGGGFWATCSTDASPELLLSGAPMQALSATVPLRRRRASRCFVPGAAEQRRSSGCVESCVVRSPVVVCRAVDHTRPSGGSILQDPLGDPGVSDRGTCQVHRVQAGVHSRCGWVCLALTAGDTGLASTRLSKGSMTQSADHQGAGEQPTCVFDSSSVVFTSCACTRLKQVDRLLRIPVCTGQAGEQCSITDTDRPGLCFFSGRRDSESGQPEASSCRCVHARCQRSVSALGVTMACSLSNTSPNSGEDNEIASVVASL